MLQIPVNTWSVGYSVPCNQEGNLLLAGFII